jgi:glycosyltransferase involved in cell wall biosynthesis
MTTILHLIPTLEGGGAERQLALLASEQSRRGLEVHIGVRRGGIHAQGLAENGVRLHFLGDFWGVHPKLWLAVRKLIKRVRPAIVQTWMLQMDIVGGFAVVASVPRWIIAERTSTGYPDLPFAERIRLQLGRFASAIVVNSEAGSQYWKQSLRRTPKLFTIQNAVDVRSIRTAPAVPDPWVSGDLILVVGRFSPEKALEIVIQAIAALPADLPVAVMMIGEGPLREPIERQIQLASLSARITILPYQPDWWGWLRSADALVSMSRYEGNPNVVLEAMAGACPLILSDIPTHREIADSSSAMLVPVDDVDGLSSAIIQLLSDKVEAKKRAARAADRVDAMTIQTTTDAYDSVYQFVLKRP